MDFCSFFTEVSPVTGSKIHAQFKHTFSNWLDVAEVPVFDPVDPGFNACPGNRTQGLEKPIFERNPPIAGVTHQNLPRKRLHSRLSAAEAVT